MNPAAPPAAGASHAAAADLRQQFEAVFGRGSGKVHVVRAPGRVNLIGEHTDYNDGYVFPMAIEPEIRFVGRSREDGMVRLASTAYPGELTEFSLNRKIDTAAGGAGGGEAGWTNYPRGIIAELIDAGIPLPGMDCLISNTLPVGGGLSSSAALLVGTGRTILALAGLGMDDQRLALLAQKAEHEYAGAPVGIMDQTIVASARAGQAMMLDCRDLTKVFVPLDPRELRVVVANSMVKHELSGGEYGERRRQCEEAVRYFQKDNSSITALRDVSVTQVESARGKLSEVVFKRARHVVGEIARTSRYAVLLGEKQYDDAGQLMVQSHASLRDDYAVSTPELDFLQEEAMKVRGVYGSRMTGGGFGGCTVALVQPRAVEPLTQHLQKTFEAKFGIQPVVFDTQAAAGASVVE
ncbi:MAG TPA: galactokinase [Tepidisphaeraceae bacterium]|nr:galactokinase [Tepidisphaeraceae bacterium]